MQSDAGDALTHQKDAAKVLKRELARGVLLGARDGERCPPPWNQFEPKIRRKNKNTFKMSRKIDAAISGAEAMSFDRRRR